MPESDALHAKFTGTQPQFDFEPILDADADMRAHFRLQSTKHRLGFANALNKESPSARGAIAQLGERLHGMQEVSGSIPLSSTKSSL